jgi:UDP-glucose 4-epimerase
VARAGFEPAARNEIFNVGADTPVTVTDLATEVCRVFGHPVQIDRQPERHEVKHAFSNHDKVRRVFGVTPPTPLADGLTRMADWVRRVDAGPIPRFEAIEIRRQLPPSWAALAKPGRST